MNSGGGRTGGRADRHTRKQVKKAAKRLCKTLNIKHDNQPHSLKELRRYKSSVGVDPDMHKMAGYVVELSLLDLPLIHPRPSKVTANKDPAIWTLQMEHYSHLKEDDVFGVACRLAFLLQSAAQSDNKWVSAWPPAA